MVNSIKCLTGVDCRHVYSTSSSVKIFNNLISLYYYPIKIMTIIQVLLALSLLHPIKPLQSGVAFCADQRLVVDDHSRLHSTTAQRRLTSIAVRGTLHPQRPRAGQGAPANGPPAQCRLITGSIARSANLPVFSLLRGRFWGFSPRRGDTLHRWGWNLAYAKFHPHRCNDKGVGPPKLKFLLRFDRNLEPHR